MAEFGLRKRHIDFVGDAKSLLSAIAEELEHSINILIENLNSISDYDKLLMEAMKKNIESFSQFLSGPCEGIYLYNVEEYYLLTLNKQEKEIIIDTINNTDDWNLEALSEKLMKNSETLIRFLDLTTHSDRIDFIDQFINKLNSIDRDVDGVFLNMDEINLIIEVSYCLNQRDIVLSLYNKIDASEAIKIDWDYFEEMFRS